MVLGKLLNLLEPQSPHLSGRTLQNLGDLLRHSKPAPSPVCGMWVFGESELLVVVLAHVDRL